MNFQLVKNVNFFWDGFLKKIHGDPLHGPLLGFKSMGGSSSVVVICSFFHRNPLCSVFLSDVLVV